MRIRTEDAQNRERRDQEFQLERERMKIQAERVNNDVTNSSQSSDESSQTNRKKFVIIDIEKWKPEETDLNTFLSRFETCAKALEVNGNMKGSELIRCFERTALELVSTLSEEERHNYEAIKKIVQHRFRCTEGYCRKLFKSAKSRAGERSR